MGNSSENLRKMNIAVVFIVLYTEVFSSYVKSLIKSVFPAVKQKERKEKEGKFEGEAVFFFFLNKKYHRSILFGKMFFVGQV